MRVFSLVWSFYVLLLASVPCSDEPVSDVATDQTVVAASQSDAHPHGHDSEDFCTPFCQCHCCHSHVVFFAAFGSLDRPEPVTPSFINYTPQAEQSYAFSLFQPPQG
ncbi:DUF6660 family protein [Tunicatimonas pelagia]|uniref:DUF6660 family protein n=1 Tax=Tunicatimonas pelagia TaxID=931531 RepID=UPI002666F6F7|nr:DUF6660 family protein [Tunicatimonas pelagia]WKN45403.1 hypothetical protein P0M28_10585 [Tunicatimonas pelagia]